MIDGKIEISASIMCINWLHVEADLRLLETNGIDYLHWDVIDGQFAPDFTMGSSIINRLRAASTLRSEYHLMVLEPSRIFDTFTFNPTDTLIIHQECCRNLHRDLVNIRRRGIGVGVALNPATPLETLEYVIEEVDVVLLMTVNPGFMGQRLVPQTLRKIEELRQLIADRQLPTKIEVDGSVSQTYIADMVAAGADILVGGSSGLFRQDVDLSSAIRYFNDAVRTGLTRRGDHG